MKAKAAGRQAGCSIRTVGTLRSIPQVVAERRLLPALSYERRYKVLIQSTDTKVGKSV